ncbi:type I methionyl aminopeptidase [Thermus filiformis]|uniref:Methionine aminopeptidase n=1 Tax=Thermus filiformis TaxID=276 RepID=A0A0D6X9N3_THEFI|nr:type I methionyl aminopeptidase [Thermus filiformis]KIX84402.1 methionine aminopeptidase [Thermus filiformis]
MAIKLKSAWELERMAEAGALLTEVVEEVARHVAPGVTTKELDRIAHEAILKRKAKPAFLGLYGFPATLCTSVNEVVVHGIPSDEPLKEGDILSIDVGLFYGGFAADMARTYPVGQVSEEARRLIEVTEAAFWEGLKLMRPGYRTGDVAHRVQTFVEGHGFHVVREFVGHGVGREIHEDPQLPNYGRPGTGPKLRPGMVLALEPMVTLRPTSVVILEDGWTASAGKGNLAAHYENTVVVTEEGPRLLTGALLAVR